MLILLSLVSYLVIFGNSGLAVSNKAHDNPRPTVLKGENKISDVRVNSVDKNGAEIEVDYYYNGKDYPLFVMVDLYSGSGTDSEKMPFPRRGLMKTGHNTYKFTISRDWRNKQRYQTGSILVSIVGPNRPDTVESKPQMVQLFKKTIDWPSVNPILTESATRAELDELYKKALALVNRGDSGALELAKDQLDKLLLADPTYLQAYIQLARYHLRSSWNSEGRKNAERVLLGSLAINPEYANTYVLLGYVYTHQKRYDEAFSAFGKAEKFRTDNRWLYVNWGEAYHKQNKLDEAIAYYTKALQPPRSHDDNDRAHDMAYQLLIQSLEEKSEFDEADKVYRQRIAVFSENWCHKIRYAEFRLNRFGFDENNLLALKASLDGCSYTDWSKKVLAKYYYVQWAMLDRAGNDPTAAAIAFNQAQALYGDLASLTTSFLKYKQSETLLSALAAKGVSFDKVFSRSVLNNDFEAAERLLFHGANINAVFQEAGWTTLIMAVMGNNEDAVKFLLNHEADPSIKGKYGYSAYRVAKEMGLANMVRLLGPKPSV